MKWATIALVTLGLIGAICAAVLVAFLRAGSGRTATPVAVQEIETLVAAADLPDLTMLDASAVEIRNVPINQRPKDALTSPVPAMGKVIRVPLVQGQPILPEHFATSGVGANLAATLPEGYRAVTLALEQSHSLHNLLYPGSVVDVMAAFRIGDDSQRRESISTTLLERVPVLAIEDRTVFGVDNDPPQSVGGTYRRLVTLRVTPEQAAQLQLACEHGTVSLAMRNPLDRARPEPVRVLLSSISRNATQAVIPPPSSDLARFLPALKPAPAKAAPPTEKVVTPPDDKPDAPPTWLVVVIRGAARETLSLPLPADDKNSPDKN